MNTFEEYLQQNHPETMEEGWGRNLMAAGLMGLGALGASGCSDGKCEVPQTQSITKQHADGVGYNKDGQIEARVTIPTFKSLGPKGSRLAGDKALMQAKSKLFVFLNGGTSKTSPGNREFSSSGRLPPGVESRVIDNHDGTVTAICTLPR